MTTCRLLVATQPKAVGKNPNCVIAHCEGHKASGGEKGRLYNFPEDEEVRNKWVDFVMAANGPGNRGDRLVVDRSSAVCDRHFRPGDYTLVMENASKRFYSSSKQRETMALRPDSVPSVLGPPPTPVPTGGGPAPTPLPRGGGPGGGPAPVPTGTGGPGPLPTGGGPAPLPTGGAAQALPTGGGGRWTPGCGPPNPTAAPSPRRTGPPPANPHKSQRLLREQLRSPQIGCTLLTKLLNSECDVDPSDKMPAPEVPVEENLLSVEPIVIEPLIEESATCEDVQTERSDSRSSQYSQGGSQYTDGGSQFTHEGSQYTQGGSQFTHGGSQYTHKGSQFTLGGSQDRQGGSQYTHGGSQYTHGGSQFTPGGSHFTPGGSQFTHKGSQFTLGGCPAEAQTFGQVLAPAALPKAESLRASPQPDSRLCYMPPVSMYCPNGYPYIAPPAYQYVYQSTTFQQVSIQRQPCYQNLPVQHQASFAAQQHHAMHYGGTQKAQTVQYLGSQQHHRALYGHTACTVSQGHPHGQASKWRKLHGAKAARLTGFSSLVPTIGSISYGDRPHQAMEPYPNSNCYSAEFSSQHLGSRANSFPVLASQLSNTQTIQRNDVQPCMAQRQPLDSVPVVGIPPLKTCSTGESLRTSSQPIVIAPKPQVTKTSCENKTNRHTNPQDDDVAMMRQSYGVCPPTGLPKVAPKGAPKGEMYISGKCFFNIQNQGSVIEEITMVLATGEKDLEYIQERTNSYLRIRKHLPDDVQVAVAELKAQALVSEKKKFFNKLTKAHLLTIGSKCEELPGFYKSIIFSHLADHLPCSKKTLTFHDWFLKTSKVEAKIKEQLETLRGTLDKEMPEQVHHYEWECRTAKKWQHQQMAMLSPGGKAPPDPPTVCDDAVCQHHLPGKKYAWSAAARQLVLDILKGKRSTFSKTNQSKVPYTERLADYVDRVVVPLWPEGWMDKETIFNEFPSVLAKPPKKGKKASDPY